MIRKSDTLQRAIILIAPILLIAGPASAQNTQSGRTAKIVNGEVGQRQARDEAAPNIQPLERISSRIQNRVQSRIRQRIDRNYTPQTDAASPFEVAGDQARNKNRIGPR